MYINEAIEKELYFLTTIKLFDFGRGPKTSKFTNSQIYQRSKLDLFEWFVFSILWLGDAVPEQCYAGSTFPKKNSGSAGEEQGITNWIILSSFNTWNAADSLYVMKIPLRRKMYTWWVDWEKNNKTFHSCTKWIIIIRAFWLCETLYIL